MTSREWVRDGTGIDWPTVLLVALTGVVLVALLVAASTSSAAFGLYNPAWDGAADFREGVAGDAGVEADVLREPSRYDEVRANETVAFVIAPEEPYGDEDAARVRRFVERGGTLVVFENVESGGNELLAAVGADARTDGRLVLDERHYDRGPAMPVATAVANHSRTAGVDRLTLNHATAIEPNDATVLVATSEYAYLGDTPDAELDDETVLGSYPVATVENVGTGEVILVGDPSLTINAMYDRPDNAAFLRAQYADEERVLFDRSHAGGVPPLVGALLTIRELPLVQAVLGGLGVATVAVVSRRRATPIVDAVRTRIWSTAPIQDTAEQRGPAAEDRAAALRERHPEWDDERIERVVKALNRTRSKREEQ